MARASHLRVGKSVLADGTGAAREQEAEGRAAMNSAVKDAVAFHSEIAAEFHASYQTHANRRERVRVWRGFLDRYARGARLAYDMGCGTGILTCELAARGIETIGIDGSEAMLNIARDTARNLGGAKVTFVQRMLPIPDTAAYARADLIISSSCIEYLESIPAALICFRELLEQRGVLIFSVSNHDSLSRKLVRSVNRLTGRPRYLGLLRHFMTAEEIRRDLEASGLVYLEHAYFAGADRFNRVLARFLPPQFTSNMIIVAALRR